MPHTSVSPADRVHAFFDRFAAASRSLDSGVLGRCFADQFLSADATGAQPVTREAFLDALPRRVEMFAKAGIDPGARLERIEQIALDDHYVLVRTQWQASRTGGGEPLSLASSFLLHDGEDLRIVLYLNHEDYPHQDQQSR